MGELPSRESYQLSKKDAEFQKIFMNWNRPVGLIHEVEE
jgi:hypothetical protein